MTASSSRAGIWRLAAVVFLAALALRYGHLLMLRSSWEETHLFSTARLDAADHMREAEDILERNFWLTDRVCWKGPGYSYFLAGLMAALGPHPGRFRWVVAFLGAVNCGALVLLARRYLGNRGAAIAGTLAAFNGILILYDGELYFPTLLVALNLPVFALLLRRRPGRWTDTAAGILLGMAVLVHPVYLLVAAAVAVWLSRLQLRRAAPFVIGVVLSFLPVTLKNVVARGQLVLVSWNGGINFFVGNQPGYDQRSGMGTEAWDRVFLSLPDAGITREADRDRYYYRLAWRQIAEAPATAAAILLEKLRVFFSPLEISNNFRIYEIPEHSPLLAATLGRAGPLYFPFGLWAPLAVVGTVVLARRRMAEHGLLLAWGLGLVLSCVLFFNTARYRAPLVFFGSIWAAAAIEECLRFLSERRWKRITLGAASFLAVATVIAAINRDQRSLPPPLEYIEAQVIEQMGNSDGAGRLIEQIARLNPEDPGLLFAASLFYLRHGQAAHGRAFARSVLALPDLSPDDRCNANEILAESYLEEANFGEAARAFDNALAVNVDAATWRGSPHFQLHVGPVTACRLRLGLADVALRQGSFDRAQALIDQVRRECGFHGRVEARRKRLEPLMRRYGASLPAEH